MPTVFPTIHLNGTSANELIQRYEAAYTALTEAARLLAQCAPHGRDYYPQGAGAYAQATREFGQAMDGLRAAADYALELGSHCIEEDLKRQTPPRGG